MAKIDDVIVQKDWAQLLTLVAFSPDETIKLDKNSIKILDAENAVLLKKVKEILSGKKQEQADAGFLIEKLERCYRASGLQFLPKDTASRNSIIRLYLFFQMRLYILVNLGAAPQVDQLIKHASGLLLRLMPLGFSPLFLAARNGHGEVCKLLLATGLISQEQKEAAFFAALKKGHVAVCKLFLENGVSVDAKEKDHPAIFLAAVFKQLDVFRLLMEYKADAYAVTPEGLNVFHSAATSGDVELCRMLLDYTANQIIEVGQKKLTGVPYFGMLPLHCAALRGNMDVCQLLLERGANVNSTDATGCSVLYLATQEAADPEVNEERRGRAIAVCKVLLLKGADPDQPDRAFVTARKQVENSNVRQLKELFIRFPAQHVPIEQTMAFIEGRVQALPKIELPAAAAAAVVSISPALNFQNEEKLLTVVSNGNLVACHFAFAEFPWSQSNFNEFRKKLLDTAKINCHPQLWLLIKEYQPGQDLVKNDRQYNSYFFFTPYSSDPRVVHSPQLRELKM